MKLEPNCRRVLYFLMTLFLLLSLNYVYLFYVYSEILQNKMHSRMFCHQSGMFLNHSNCGRFINLNHLPTCDALIIFKSFLLFSASWVVRVILSRISDSFLSKMIDWTACDASSSSFSWEIDVEF